MTANHTEGLPCARYYTVMTDNSCHDLSGPERKPRLREMKALVQVHSMNKCRTIWIGIRMLKPGLGKCLLYSRLGNQRECRHGVDSKRVYNLAGEVRP